MSSTVTRGFGQLLHLFELLQYPLPLPTGATCGHTDPLTVALLYWQQSMSCPPQAGLATHAPIVSPDKATKFPAARENKACC